MQIKCGSGLDLAVQRMNTHSEGRVIVVTDNELALAHLLQVLFLEHIAKVKGLKVKGESADHGPHRSISRRRKGKAISNLVHG